MAELLENGTLLHISLGKILTGESMARIERELAAQQNNRSLRMAVLQGAGANFSYGASVEEHRPATAPHMLKALSRLVKAIAHYPAPVAALVQGKCLGGGFELALACHLLFATPDAQLGCPEVKLGVFPPVLAALGPWKLGGWLTQRLVLTGETIDARGFATAIFEKDPLAEFLDWYRKGPAKLSAEALRNAALATRWEERGSAPRRAEAEGRSIGDARIDELERLYLDRVLPSHDGNEGIEAFVGRREPQWTDS
ncbi:MAG TPA: enoyl-CoA hydratase/isomerase family protein [Myxococcales bacterium]|nr:enoyl-CoA hydratase/isomerase family protein [Myxococcales bacterium]